MDYIDIISDNAKPEEILHEVTEKIAKSHSAVVRLMTQGNYVAAAGAMGAVALDIELLQKVDEQLNGAKKTTVIA